MDKKEYLDLLYNKFGDFEVAALTYSRAGSVNKFGRWLSYSKIKHQNKDFIDLINSRTIFNVEVVLDLEDKNRFPDVIKKLNEDKLNYYAFYSGSRGYHIHLFFPELKNYDSEMRKSIRKKIIERYNCDLNKVADRTMIALENFPHYKTGRPKILHLYKKGVNFILADPIWIARIFYDVETEEDYNRMESEIDKFNKLPLKNRKEAFLREHEEFLKYKAEVKND